MPVHASNLLDDLKESAGLDRISEILPAGLSETDVFDETSFTNEHLGREVFSRLFSSISKALREEAKLFAGILAVLLIASFARAFRYAFASDSVGDATQLVGVLVLAASCYATLYSAFLSLYDALKALCGLVGGFLPVTGAIYTLSGAATTLVAQSASMLTALAVLDSIITSYLFPLLSLSFALAAANAVSGLKLQALSRFFRKTVSVLLGALFTVLLFILSIQTLIGAANDTLVLRGSRYAAANFVPAVGNLFGEAAKSVFAALNVVRTEVGTVAVFAILWILLAPLVGLGVRRALFHLCSAIASALDLDAQAQFLSECGETLGLGLAIGLSCGIFFVLAFAVFLCVPIGG